MQEIVKNTQYSQYYVMKYNGETWYNKNKVKIVADKRDKIFLETKQYVCVAILASPQPVTYLEEVFKNAIWT